MIDVSPARVQVTPSRLKKLKRIISNCDREIQFIDAGIIQAESSLEIGRYTGNSHLPCYARWEPILDSRIARRKVVDEKRRLARLEIKGYCKSDRPYAATPLTAPCNTPSKPIAN